LALVLVVACAAEEKKTEKRGIFGLGYGYGDLGYGYGGYRGLPIGYDHGYGLPLHGAYPYGHGYVAPAIHAPIIPKVAPIDYAAPLHAPLLPKAYPHFGYSAPYLGYDNGFPLLH
jgi:hypothetical protein